MPSSTKQPVRRSIFREEGLDDLNCNTNKPIEYCDPAQAPREGRLANVTFDQILRDHDQANMDSTKRERKSAWLPKVTRQRPVVRSVANAPPRSFMTLSRTALVVFLIAVVVPGFRYSTGRQKVNIPGADAGVIFRGQLVDNGSMLEGRENSPTSTCTRWSHQMTNVNGTVYIYGGQAKQSAGQSSNVWNNDFLTLDLTKTWEISSPVISGLPQPSGPPAVAMGSLWRGYDKLWLYGGMFSDNPATSPLPVSTWEYDIKGGQWSEFANPQSSAGNHSDGGGQPVQRAAEGAGLSVPELGRSWYFGGHLDLYTTEGWSNQVARVYLKSMLEFTHPGYANSGVESLGGTNAAGNEGVYRNITEGGLQESAGFTERADGSLVYVPGWGSEGIILGLAGGTNETFTEMNIIDVYDIANSTWYKQSTSGPSPPIRVNPCTVVAAAPDGSSFNVYLYGGQNLVPFGSQIQYSDMWILTIPSFTWIEVNLEGQSQPPARAGHSCTLWDGQMVVVGGYVGKDISCDSPGVYVFNASSLEWTSGFTSLSQSSDTIDPSGSTILQGSVGYEVPGPVQSVIGGSAQGGATATQPAAGSATAGPIATGKPPTFTVTQSGSVVTQTSQPAAGAGQARSGRNGAIIAGVVAGVLALLAVYLAFCTWLYRRQLKQYKNHVAMAQRTAFNNSPEPGSWGGSVAGSADGRGGGRLSEKAGVLLGPFGTQIGGSASGSASAGRSSTGESYHSNPPGLTPSSNLTPGSATAAEDQHGYGAGTMPGGKGYGPLGEEFETGYMGGGPGRHSGSTAHSSTEDLISGQEPTFFNVMLNPRRTLRVVNSD